jgi:rhodanese-related sulfurtransferase
MNGKNLFGIILLIILGIFIAFTSLKKHGKTEIEPDKLINKTIQKTRYVLPEEVAESIISEDPTLQLIDVRTHKFYSKFTLKGAINIPLSELFKEENLAYFDQDIYKTILFSNGTSDADVAWILATRLGYKNIYVMKGGLNQWVENILQPKENEVIWDRVDDQLYQYRKGASEYFGGKVVEPEEGVSAPKTKTPIVKKGKKQVSGGCG